MTRCDVLGRVVTCTLNDYGRKVEVALPCPSGQHCITKQLDRRDRFDNLHFGEVRERSGACQPEQPGKRGY